MNHIRELAVFERAAVSNDGTSGRNRALHSEQQAAVWWKNVIRKFNSLGQRFVNPCAGIYAATSDSMLLWRHGRFVE